MDIIYTIVVFLLIFSVLVLIHELGHFVMAKRAGIKVEEFGFGLPPRIWGKKKGETIYSVNWIPFGGFVRMLGDDGSDPKLLKKKRSFAAAPMRARIKVVVAGVIMNFFLAWILLTVGFSFGMQPLLGPDDVLPAVSSGVIQLTEGAKLVEVAEDGFAHKLGLKPDDVLVEINDQTVDQQLLTKFLQSPIGTYRVNRDGEIFTYEATQEFVDEYFDGESLGLEFGDFAPFPRVKVFEVAPSSDLYLAGMRPGDIIVTVNGQQVYTVEELEELTRGEKVLEYEYYRDGLRDKLLIESGDVKKVVVSRLIPDMPAEKVGLEAADVIVSVNGKEFSDSEDLIAFVSEHSSENLGFMVYRDDETIFYEIKPEDGKIGVYLSELMSYSGEQHISLYNVDLLSSVLDIGDEQYPVHVAAYRSVVESYRMAKLTAKMFVGMIVKLASGGGVPDGVSGPVGIAQLTYTFMQDGIISLLRFVAILSLSLAVINILPFPALDGGRLLFIIVELIIGRKVDQRLESLIHALGYVLILLLILAVTYSDIMRFF